MNDTSPTIVSRFFTWLPLASLALSAAAFSLGAPAAVSRCIRPSVAPSFAAALENAVREEPVVLPLPAPLRRPRRSPPLLARR